MKYTYKGIEIEKRTTVVFPQGSTTYYYAKVGDEEIKTWSLKSMKEKIKSRV